MLASVAISQAFPFVKEFSDAKFASERLLKVINHSAPDVFDENNGIIPENNNANGCLKFENVSFSYAARPNQLVC